MLFSEPTWMMPINGYRFTKSSEFLCRRVTGNLGGRGWNIKFHWPRNYMIRVKLWLRVEKTGVAKDTASPPDRI